MDAQQLNRTGCCALAARIISDCIGASRLNPALLDVALDWAVMCGYDPIKVAPELAKRAEEARRREWTLGLEREKMT